MIFYDKFYNLIGINEKALKLLEYRSIDEFLKEHKDIDNVSHEYKKSNQDLSFVQDILSYPNHTKQIFLKTKSGQIIDVIAKANVILLADSDRMYKIELNINDSDKSIKDKENTSNLPKLRLPLLKIQKNHNIDTMYHNVLLDEKWLKQTQFLLNLTQKELLEYLKLFVINANKSDILLQNAILTRDTVNLKKIIARLKKPATNLHITPLVKIYSLLQNADKSQYRELLINAQKAVNELNYLINKYQEQV